MFNGWHRAQKLFGKARSALQVRRVERTNGLEKANQDLKAAQAELQKRWQYLAEAQKLSHSGTFGWKVRTTPPSQSKPVLTLEPSGYSSAFASSRLPLKW